MTKDDTIKLAGAYEDRKGELKVVFQDPPNQVCVVGIRSVPTEVRTEDGDTLIPRSATTVAVGLLGTQPGNAWDYLYVEATRDGCFLVPDDEIPPEAVEAARVYVEEHFALCEATCD